MTLQKGRDGQAPASLFSAVGDEPVMKRYDRIIVERGTKSH